MVLRVQNGVRFVVVKKHVFVRLVEEVGKLSVYDEEGEFHQDDDPRHSAKGVEDARDGLDVEDHFGHEGNNNDAIEDVQNGERVLIEGVFVKQEENRKDERNFDKLEKLAMDLKVVKVVVGQGLVSDPKSRQGEAAAEDQKEDGGEIDVECLEGDVVDDVVGVARFGHFSVKGKDKQEQELEEEDPCGEVEKDVSRT